MNNAIKTGRIEYKVYKNGKKCRKDSLCKIYPEGAILLYQYGFEEIDVFCEIKTDGKDIDQVINDISAIKLPEQALCCDCLCILPETASDPTLLKAQLVVNSYMSEKEDDYNTCVLKQISDEDCRLYYVIINAFDPMDVFSFGRGRFNELTDPNCVREDSVFKQIKKWCKNTTFNQFRHAIEERVIGQASLSLVLVNVYQYLQCIANKKPISKMSMILTGPSGCGKTETMRALKEYFSKKIPGFIVSLVDMNQITGEGFKGQDTKYLVSELMAGGSDGIGIVFLDEFDKRLMPCYSGSGDNVNAEIQHQLLEAIEGYVFREGDSTVDTSKTMFIGMGSFDVIRQHREQRAASSCKFGFGVDKNNHEVDHFDEITRKDMIELGACYELIGRFGQIVNYGALSYAAIDNIINMRVNSVSEAIGIKITINKSMREFLHQNSNTNYGNRLIESLIRETVSRALVDVYTKETSVSMITITGENKYKIVKRTSVKQDEVMPGA